MLNGKKWLCLISIFAFLGLISGCETQDDNKIAEAQACLDGLGSNPSPSAAQACSDKIAGINSSDAYIIRCSVAFIVGGVTTTGLLNAYSQAETAPSAQQAAIYMAALAQTSTADANNTYSMCQNSGVESLTYIAGISQMGTIMTVTAGSTDPATFLATCASAPGTCDDTAIGQTAVNLGSQYCVGSAATNIACTTLNQAIATGGGNPANIAQALYGLLR